MKKNCLICGKEFKTHPSLIKRGGGKYCSVKCSIVHLKEIGNPGAFKKGYIPKVKIKKGEHISKATEFKKGNKPANWCKIGTIKIRKFYKRQRYSQKFIKIAEPAKWEPYNRYLWKKHKGPIPKGMIVGFKNGNALDNRLGNLILLTRGENINRNRELIQAFRKDIIPESVLKENKIEEDEYEY